jgi:hypothetical protein
MSQQGLFTSFGEGALALFVGKKYAVFILLGKIYFPQAVGVWFYNQIYYK